MNVFGLIGRETLYMKEMMKIGGKLSETYKYIHKTCGTITDREENLWKTIEFMIMLCWAN